jgi:predicted phage terminase large subunit-like protein
MHMNEVAGSALTDAEYGLLLRANLGLFVERVFAHLHPGTAFLPNWHLDLIASRLEDVYEGKTRRLIVNVPPRSLKSIMASVSFVAWALGHRPGLDVICASYGQDLAETMASDCRRVMQSEWYQRMFGTVLKGARPSVADLRTVAGGGRFATSVDGGMTGRGGGIVILDDPLKPAEALSDTERKRVNEWFDHTVFSRLNDKVTGAIVVIMQRLHEDDLVGHLIQDRSWDVLALPAIAETETRYEYRTFQGLQVHLRRPGDVLHPAREPQELLNALQERLGEYHFSGQYQQAPAPLGGGMFKSEWLQSTTPSEWPTTFEQIVQSWDTASKESELADYSVCTTWGLKGPNKYLRDVRRERMDFPALKRTVIAQIQAFRPDVVLIEDKASGIQLIQDLRAMGHSVVKEYKPVGDKVMRASAQTAEFEGGFVKLPSEAPWLEAYRQELTTFPRGRFDDQVDSTSQALAWIAEAGREPGIITYYRQLLEDMKRGKT